MLVEGVSTDHTGNPAWVGGDLDDGGVMTRETAAAISPLEVEAILAQMSTQTLLA